MDFWNDIDDDELNSSGSIETFAGFDVIPAKTQLVACIDSIGWKESDKEPDYIEIKWNVESPEAYKNRKVFHKIRVKIDDQEKRIKALKMLSAIDANSGGKLRASGKNPTDDLLERCMLGKRMLIKVQVWNNENKKPSGNWVSGIDPLPGKQATAPKKQAAPAEQTPIDEDDIPF